MTTANSSALDIMLGDDSDDDYLKRWKQACPEHQLLVDQHDGRTVEGLRRAARKMAAQTQKDPLQARPGRQAW